MGIKIIKGGETIREFSIELWHISPKFLSKSFAEIREAEDIELLISDLEKNRKKIKDDVGKYVLITTVDGEDKDIPFEVFFSGLVDVLNAIIEMYGNDKDVEVDIG